MDDGGLWRVVKTTDAQIYGYQVGREGGMNQVGGWDWHINPTMYKMGN